MARLVGLSGSLRKASFNTRLLRSAASLMPEGSRLDVRTVHGIPLFDGDAEAALGLPEPVAVLKEVIAEADGLLIASPEYNNSVPGVLKNAIDWLSRPPSDIARVFGGKPVAVCGASPGGFGTRLAQSAWLPVFHCLGASVYSGRRLEVSRARDVWHEDGTIGDEAVVRRLTSFLEDFVAFAARR